jgi:hypothetical protein
MKSETRKPKSERRPKAETRKGKGRPAGHLAERSENFLRNLGHNLSWASGPRQTCGDCAKKKTAQAIQQKQKLIVLLVTCEDIRAVHRFLRFSPDVGLKTAAGVMPIMQGIARGWLFCNGMK